MELGAAVTAVSAVLEERLLPSKHTVCVLLRLMLLLLLLCLCLSIFPP